MDKNSFYCYSNRLKAFLISMKFRYVSHGINSNTNKEYWTFDKSENLDSAIEMYNTIKYKFN